MKENIDPKMHTAEHLLNQAMVRLIGTDRCFSAHIEKKKSKCDYYFNRSLTEDEIFKIEELINTIIGQRLQIFEEFIPLSEAEARFDLNRLPDGVRPDPVRIIVIGDYDAALCQGPHADHTAELGQFRIISSDHNDGVLRIRYKLS